MALWPALWELVALGPLGATRRIEATLQAAGHGLTLQGEIRQTGALSAITVDGLSASFGRLVRAVIELRKQSLDPSLGLQLPAEFDAWTQDALPKRRTAYELGARQQRRNNTKAVRLRLARLALQTLNAHIERNRRPSYQLGVYLRNRVLIGVLLLGPRIGTVAFLEVRDYDPVHEFPDGVVGPALHFRALKGMPGISRWRGVPPLLARWIDEYLDYYGMANEPQTPFWVTKRERDRRIRRPTTATLTAAVVACFQRVQPRDDPRPYRPHSLRHLAEQVCFDAALDYLAEHRRDLLHNESGRGLPANPQVLCDCLLDHALHDISDRYKDINNEDGREIWGRFAAILVWDYVWGDKGARRIHDLKGIREAQVALEGVLSEERDLRLRIGALEHQRETVQRDADRQLQVVIAKLKQLNDDAKWQAHFEQVAAMREVARIDQEIKREAFELVELTRNIERANRNVELAREADVPIPDALTDKQVACLDMSVQLTGCDDSALRRSFTEDEFLWALGGGISAAHLQRYLDGELSFGRLFAGDAGGEPRGIERRDDDSILIHFDALPIERYHPAVVERLQWLMRYPTGEAPIKRRRRTRRHAAQNSR